MALSRDEQAALSTIEAALREQDPTLAHTLTTFTRPRRRWLWATLISLLILVPMVLTFAFKLHSRMLIFVGAALLAALFATIAALGGALGEEITAVDDSEGGR